MSPPATTAEADGKGGGDPWAGFGDGLRPAGNFGAFAALGVGFAVGFGVGRGVGFGVGLGVGLGVGFGVGVGAATVIGLGVGLEIVLNVDP